MTELQPTQQDLNDWMHNPVTKHIFKDIQHKIQQLNARKRMSDSVESTAMKASYIDGFNDGLTALENAYYNLKSFED